MFLTWNGFWKNSLPWRIASDEIMHEKAFNIANNPKYDGFQRGLASMVYNFYDKKLLALVL